MIEQSDPAARDVDSFLGTLTTRGYHGLGVTAQPIDCTHCAIVPAAFQAGFVAVSA